MTGDRPSQAQPSSGGLRANEVRLFGGVSAYGLFIATVYWFVSYDLTGTVLLGGFGVATGAAFAALWRATRHGGDAGASADPGAGGEAGPGGATGVGWTGRPEGPLGDDSGPVPIRSIAPLWLGLGLTCVGLSLVYGIWFAIAGLLPLGLGAVDWLSAAGREIRLLHSGPHGDDREE